MLKLFLKKNDIANKEEFRAKENRAQLHMFYEILVSEILNYRKLY